MCIKQYAQAILGLNEKDIIYSVANIAFAYGLGNSLYILPKSEPCLNSTTLWDDFFCPIPLLTILNAIDQRYFLAYLVFMPES